RAHERVALQDRLVRLEAEGIRPEEERSRRDLGLGGEGSRDDVEERHQRDRADGDEECDVEDVEDTTRGGIEAILLASHQKIPVWLRRRDSQFAPKRRMTPTTALKRPTAVLYEYEPCVIPRKYTKVSNTSAVSRLSELVMR